MKTLVGFIIGGVVGFITGVNYGIYQLVEVEDSKIVSFIRIIKGIWEVM